MDEPTRRADAPDDATLRAGDDATLRAGDEATLRAGEEATRRAGPPPAGGGARHPLGALPPGHRLCGDYVVRETLRAHESARPGVYLCDGPDGPVIVKVAAAEHPVRQELWSRLTELRHPNVAETSRTLEVDGFSFEVQRYYEGGTVQDLVPAAGGPPARDAGWVMGTLLPQALAGLAYLHSQGVVHRDIKPANLYLTRDEAGREVIVLGDFDISAVLDLGATSRETQRAHGTWDYAAPETFPRFVDSRVSRRASRVNWSCDYYSLALTVIKLLQGFTPLEMCEFADKFDFYLEGRKVVVPEGLPEPLELLLRGLLIRDYHQRWGEDECARWLAGANTEADLARIRDDETYVLARRARPYELGSHRPTDLPQLAAAMVAEPALATDDLMQRHLLINWVGESSITHARQIDEQREKWRQEPAVAWLAAVMICDPSQPFPFPDGTTADDPLSWITAARAFVQATGSDSAGFCTPVRLHQLAVWLRLGDAPEPGLADEVEKLLDLAAGLRLDALHYLFDLARPFTVGGQAVGQTPAEVARWAYGQPADWSSGEAPRYKVVRQAWTDGQLSVWLRQRGLGELDGAMARAANGLSGAPRAAFETVLRLLDPTLPKVKLVLDTGPLATVFRTPYGQQATLRLKYQVEGCGVPFGAFELQGAEACLHLASPQVSGRRGELAVVLDGDQDLPVARDFQARLAFASGFVELVAGRTAIGYRVDYPLSLTLQRMAIGALVGVVLLGVPRAFVEAGGTDGPVELGRIDPGWVWRATTKWEFPLFHCLIGFGLALALGYGTFQLWLHFVRRNAQN